MTHFYSTFCPNTTDDKERDEILNQKISIFRWIREKHLDIPESDRNESFFSFAEEGSYRPLFTKRMMILIHLYVEILKINNYKAPRDKLICILNCCKVIFGIEMTMKVQHKICIPTPVLIGLIKHVEGDAGADKFLPILIYVVIRANPPRLVSNVQ